MVGNQEAKPPRAGELRSAAEQAEQRASEALKGGDVAAAEAAIDQARILRAAAEQENRLTAIERALGMPAKD